VQPAAEAHNELPVGSEQGAMPEAVASYTIDELTAKVANSKWRYNLAKSPGDWAVEAMTGYGIVMLGRAQRAQGLPIRWPDAWKFKKNLQMRIDEQGADEVYSCLTAIGHEWGELLNRLDDASDVAPQTNIPTHPKVWADALKLGRKRCLGQATETLTDAQKEAVRTSLDSMRTYIQYGSKAIGHDNPAEAFEPTELNWAAIPGVSTDDLKLDQWTNHHFAGYAWLLICWARQNVCEPELSLRVPNWGRLKTDISELRKRETAHQLYHRIRMMAQHWPLICYLAGNIGKNLEPDDSVFSHGVVQRYLNVILERSNDWIEIQYARMEEGLPPSA
jgi:hypothetical protein